MNRRLARRLANELKDAVLGLGGQARVQWLGSSAFRMTVQGADPPFRDVSIVVALRPREMPLNWALGLAAGRSDTAVLDASLRGRPAVDLELVNPRTSVGRRRAATSAEWSPWTFAGRPFLLAADDGDAARALLEPLTTHAGDLAALRIAADGEAAIAASVSLVPGRVSRTIEALRDLARAATAQ